MGKAKLSIKRIGVARVTMMLLTRTLIWTTFSKETGSMHFQRKKVWYNRSTWTKKEVEEKKMTRKMEGKARE
jgi:hypothetical protein